MNFDEYTLKLSETKTIEEAIEIMRAHAPNKHNCFTCKQRCLGDCPAFNSSPIEIDTLCAVNVDMFKLVGFLTVVGCDTYAE